MGSSAGGGGVSERTRLNPSIIHKNYIIRKPSDRTAAEILEEGFFIAGKAGWMDETLSPGIHDGNPDNFPQYTRHIIQFMKNGKKKNMQLRKNGRNRAEYKL